MNSAGSVLIVIGSILAASIFQLLPMKGYFLLWKPNFLFLIAMAWIIFSPGQRGIGFAAFLGLLADLIFRAPIGLHILLFGVVGAIPLLVTRWLVYFTILHRCLFIGLLVVVAELVGNMLFGIWGVPTHYGAIPMKALISASMWPLIDQLLAKVTLDY